MTDTVFATAGAKLVKAKLPEAKNSSPVPTDAATGVATGVTTGGVTTGTGVGAVIVMSAVVVLEAFVLDAAAVMVTVQTPAPTVVTTPLTGSTVQIEAGEVVEKLNTPFPEFDGAKVTVAPGKYEVPFTGAGMLMLSEGVTRGGGGEGGEYPPPPPPPEGGGVGGDGGGGGEVTAKMGSVVKLSVIVPDCVAVPTGVATPLTIA